MTKPTALGLCLALLFAAAARAEDAEERPAPAYDEVNVPFALLVARATQEQRPIFIEFYTAG